MEIIEKFIDELIPYENNPRNNDAAVEYVANSIREFGFKNPIIIDKNNVIVAWHTRTKAAEKLEMVKVPTIMADDLTDEQVKAFRLADNKVSEISGWDFSLLEQELSELESVFEMEDFGFDCFEYTEDDLDLKEKELTDYEYIHYLVTINRSQEMDFKDKIEEIKSMGAEVRETRNNT